MQRMCHFRRAPLLVTLLHTESVAMLFPSLWDLIASPPRRIIDAARCLAPSTCHTSLVSSSSSSSSFRGWIPRASRLPKFRAPTDTPRDAERRGNAGRDRYLPGFFAGFKRPREFYGRGARRARYANIAGEGESRRLGQATAAAASLAISQAAMRLHIEAFASLINALSRERADKRTDGPGLSNVNCILIIYSATLARHLSSQGRASRDSYFIFVRRSFVMARLFIPVEKSDILMGSSSLPPPARERRRNSISEKYFPRSQACVSLSIALRFI